MAKKLETIVPVDIVLKKGKVVGQEDIVALITKTIKQMDLPPLDVPVVINPDASLEDITGLMNKINTELKKALDPEAGLDPKSHLAKMAPEQVRAYQQAFTKLDTLARQQQGVLGGKEFQTRDFKKAYGIWARGYVRDPITKEVREVNEATLESLTNITDSAGKPLFTKQSVNNIKTYEAELGKLRKTLLEVDRLSSKIRSVNVQAGGGKSGAGLGSQARDRKTEPGFLAREAEVLQEDIKAVKSGYVSERKAIEDKQRALDLAERQERQREKLRADAAARKKKRDQEAARVSQRERTEQARVTQGNQALLRLRRGEQLGLQKYKDATFALNKKLEETITLRDRLSAGGKSKGFESWVDRLSAKADRLQKELKDVSRAQNEASRINPAAVTLERAGLTPAQARKRVQQRNIIAAGRRSFVEAGGFGGTFSVAQRDLASVVDFHKAKVDQIRRIQSQLNTSTERGARTFERLRTPLFNHSRDLEHARDRMRQFGGVTQQTAALLRQFFRYAIGYGALYQVLAAVRALTAGVLELDKALRGIQAVTQATNREMKLIETGIKAVALETQFNTAEISEAAQILGQAGVIPAELPAALRATALFASATGSAIQLSADLVTSMRNVFTTLSDDSIANQLTQAINISKLTAGDLKTVISLSSQIAKSYDLTADQYLAAVTTLRNAGIKPSTVATGLRQGLIEIFSPDSKTIQALKSRYKQLGEELSTDEIRDKFFGFQLKGNPLVNALRELQRLGFTGEGKKTVQRAYDIRAENAISALINNLDEVEQSASRLTFGEAAARAAETQMESLTHSLRNLGAAISVFAHDTTNDWVGSFENLADKITEGVRALTDFNLQLEVLRGHGIGVQSLIAGAAGVVGGSLTKAGIPGKAFVGAVSAKTAFDLSSEAADIKEGTEEGVKSVWEQIVEYVKTTLVLLSPLLAVELFNLVRGKGSPLLEGIFRRRSRVTGIPQTRGTGPVGRVVGRAGALVSNTRLGQTASLALTQLGVMFAHPIWQKVVTAASALLGFLKRHPVILFITTMSAIVSGLTKLYDSTATKNLTKQFDAAIKRRDRASAEFKRLLASQDEYRFSTPTKAATEGTTAASIEAIEKDLEEYKELTRRYFGREADDIEALTDKLTRFVDLAPEAGTEAAEEAYSELEDAITKSEIDTAITDTKARDLAFQGKRIISTATALKDNLSRLLTSLYEQGDDISEVDKTYLKAFDIITKGKAANQNILFGQGLGDSPIQAARDLTDFVRKFYTEQQRLYEETEEFKKASALVTETDVQALQTMIERVRTSPNRRAMLQAIKDWGKSLSDLTDEGITALNEQVQQLDAEREKIRERLFARPEQLRAEIAEAKETYAGFSRKQRREQGAELLQYLEKKEEELARLDEARAVDFGNLVSTNISRGVTSDRVREAADIRSKNVEKESELLFRRMRSYYEQFAGPDAKETDRNAFDRFITERARRGDTSSLRSTSELIFGAIEKGEAKRLPGEFPPTDLGFKTVPDSFYELDAAMQDLQKNVADRARQETGLYQDVEQYKRVQSALMAVNNARTSKNYELLATEDQEKNLNRIYFRERRKEIEAKRTFNRNLQPVGDQELRKKEKTEYDLYLELIKTRREEEEAVLKDQVALAKQRLAIFDAENKALLAGLRKQLARAIDAGLFERARELDQKILDIKGRRATLEEQKLRAEGASEQVLTNFRYDVSQDTIPVTSVPAQARRIIAGVKRRLERDSEPRLSEDSEEQGLLQQQGVVTSIEQRDLSRLENIARTRAEVEGLQREINEILSEGPPSGETVDSINTIRDAIRELNEEIGELTGEGLDESKLGNLAYQLDKGFDLNNVGNQLDQLDSSIGNLGNTIQNDIVTGIDGIAGGFAEALVAGENFTDGLRQGFAQMLQQIAADIIKSGIIKLLSSFFGASFFSGGGALGSSAPIQQGLAKGGPIEKKAAGGTISGPGTGTSDSVYGTVTDARGNVTRGIRVSDGEGIVTAKAMGVLGEGFLNKINEASTATLSAIKKGTMGFRRGGVPSPAKNYRRAAVGASLGMQPVLMMATGGVVKDMKGMAASMKMGGNHTTVNHSFTSQLDITADDGSSLDPDTLRRLDDGINLRIQEYVENELRPGGLLQAARQGARR